MLPRRAGRGPRRTSERDRLQSGMLDLARKHAPAVAEQLGYAIVEFRCGVIQDLALDLDALEVELSETLVSDPVNYSTLQHAEERLRRDCPLVPNDSVDCVLSNCVLNLVRGQDRRQLFAEIFRVLRFAGRAAEQRCLDACQPSTSLMLSASQMIA
ncbi:SAM-dependent methyltransferase [Rhodopirellula rubra]|uniref:SAM-dependent methyltransferase n=2 Tax=Aporhodopirellula rubra TaxID=980271 RepID=A0A7W5H5D1_9BACT|nr:methyltransferase domain-containing protein [Aporhodopirellula rubra]MBB3205716.1 SAM-dependent methyltransferase [Aporhodopirellula rubra]